jgi:methylamine---glutamate N-methyltransferase subunit C
MFLRASVALSQVLARDCALRRLSEFNLGDLTTFERDMAHLTRVA